MNNVKILNIIWDNNIWIHKTRNVSVLWSWISLSTVWSSLGRRFEIRAVTSWQKLREMNRTYRTSSVIYFTFQNQPSEQTRFWKYLYHKLSQVSYSSFWKRHSPKSSAIQKFHWCSLLAIIYACQWNLKGQLDTLTFNAVVRGSKLVVSYCVHTRVIYSAFAHIEQ